MTTHVQYLEKNSCLSGFLTENCISEINDVMCVRKASFSNEKVQLLCKNARRIFFSLFLCMYFDVVVQNEIQF